MSTQDDRGDPKRIADPRALKALAHPMRMRLISELATRGSCRAVDLAKALGEPANSVSFHLRQLARYGLVVEDTERGTDGRERWWRTPSAQGFIVNLDELRKLPGGPQAVGVFEQVTEGSAHALVSLAFSRIDAPDDSARSWVNDFGLHLSREEVDEFLEEQWQFMMRWMDRSRHLSQSGDDVERHTYYTMMFGAPVDEVLTSEESEPRTSPKEAADRE
ncbi:ArsR/SmtB family transcription factor [Flexivirga sp. B27]